MRSSMTVRIAFRNSTREFDRCWRTVGETPTNSRTVSISSQVNAAIVDVPVTDNQVVGAGAELVRAIRRISQARSRLGEIEAEMQELLRSDLYQLRWRVEEAQKHGRDVLREMTDKVEEQIGQAKRRLEAGDLSGR